jgi:hypothetical protein
LCWGAEATRDPVRALPGRWLHEELFRGDLAVLDLVGADLCKLHAASAFHGHIHRKRHGDGISGHQRLSVATTAGMILLVLTGRSGFTPTA